MNDLAEHCTYIEEPISTLYKGYRVHELPPPTQGIAALIALNILTELHLLNPIPSDTPLDTVVDTHLAIEAMRLALADTLEYVADPKHAPNYVQPLLSKSYAQSRAALIKCTQAATVYAGELNNSSTSSSSSSNSNSNNDNNPFATSETVYFSVVDREGNGCSMINSNYEGFGTGMVPAGCGFTLQNRAHNFSLDPKHPNRAAPRKKPYHTIIPALVTRESDGSLYSVLGVMGGFMQPQGHVQVIRNLVDFKMNPQQALDAPRWRVEGAGNSQSATELQESRLLMEDGFKGDGNGSNVVAVRSEGDEDGDGGGDGEGGKRNPIESETIEQNKRRRLMAVEKEITVLEGLVRMGHHITIKRLSQRGLFGRGQVIVRDEGSGVLQGGTDPRADGICVPQLAKGVVDGPSSGSSSSSSSSGSSGSGSGSGSR